ncbi:hypothetical protein FIBSPDRAFT_881507 [Athelia psychrophila]|uniref:Uncharacterized protein n=1 Tax=Athelia psychrophila TaxID=1759441 RepID=A0A166WS46_9AGAM|nr:hypothetical protein FIBSPDRAFT_881507 [Fibularhizoctonia sp. CBS 109695]
MSPTKIQIRSALPDKCLYRCIYVRGVHPHIEASIEASAPFAATKTAPSRYQPDADVQNGQRYSIQIQSLKKGSASREMKDEPEQMHQGRRGVLHSPDGHIWSEVGLVCLCGREGTRVCEHGPGVHLVVWGAHVGLADTLGG